MESQWNNSQGEHLSVLVKLVLSENQELIQMMTTSCLDPLHNSLVGLLNACTLITFLAPVSILQVIVLHGKGNIPSWLISQCTHMWLWKFV